MTETTLPKGRAAKAWTDRGLQSLKVEERTDLTDPSTKGLVLRVTPAGAKTWSFVYRRKSDGLKGRVTIGAFGSKAGEYGLAAARDRAATLRGEVIAKRDPGLEAAAVRKADTLSELLDAFIADHPRQGVRWTLECARIFEKEVKPVIGTVKLPELERHHIRAVLQKVKARDIPVAVNRVLAALRRALAWGVEQDLLKANPAAGIKTNVIETPKDRALTQAEIASFWHGLDKAGMSNLSKVALKVVLLTGQRPGEVCGIVKSELDFEAQTWTLPKGRTKNGKVHVVPLHPSAVALLQEAMAMEPDSLFVFSTKSRAKQGLSQVKSMDGHALSHAMRDSLEALGLTENPATPHDLRRTTATHLARMGFTDHVVGKVLNHRTGDSQTITARVYVQHDFLAEKRAALEAWGNEMERIVGLRADGSNIVNMRA